MQANSHFTFLQLLEQSTDFYIEIPAIQRDYAQGRPQVKRVRESFLAAIQKALLEGKALDLDFVYGNTKKTELGQAFVPIDGQQRLTTLFLLHWYLAYVEGKTSFRELQKRFQLPNGKPRFSYATRASAQEFCQALVQQAALDTRPRSLKDDFKAFLKDCSWFYSSWEQDPTVRAMLHMLQALHVYFYKDRKAAYAALFGQNYLQFEVLNLDDWQLTDDLYIKMNSRGRPLTDFENFKAALNQHLQAHYQGEAATVQHFFYQLDNAWNDTFWQLSQRLTVDYDEAFMRFFNFFLSLLFYWNAPADTRYRGEKDALVLLEEVENLELLTHVMDGLAATLAESPAGIQQFFEQLAGSKGVPLLTADVNLLDACLEDNRFHSRAQVLLFATLYFQAKAVGGAYHINQSFLDFFRVCRNLTWSLEQSSKDEWLPALREKSYHGLLQSFRFCFAKKHIYRHLAAAATAPLLARGAVEQELLKARLIIKDKAYKTLLHQLEDHPLLRGALHNFELENSSLVQLEQQLAAFYHLWPDGEGAIQDGLCARALLAISLYAQNISGSALGWAWYFGQGRRWARILRARSPRVQQALSGLLTTLSGIPANKINKVLEQHIQSAAQNTALAPWHRAFLSYPCILKSEEAHVSYAFFSDSSDDYRVEKILGKTLKSSHINVYVEALAEALEQKEGLVYARNRESSCLQISQGIQLYAENGGWHIYGLGIPDAALLAAFDLEEDARYTVKTLHKLAVGIEEDMVEVGLELVKFIINKN